jgi:hypothetical protein
MYLVDTNIWLERLLDQARSEEVGEFLSQIPTEHLLMSDFSLHSIGVILTRLGQTDTLPEFVDDVFIQGGVTLISVPPANMCQLVAGINQFNLDFDDAYQYAAAKQYSATIISFDSDFDRTDAGRQTPQAILSTLNQTNA